jgi:hypothetical protein
MNDNLDGNTAALNAYELDQEKLFRAAEIAADDKEMRLDDLVLAQIETDGFIALEAIGTEATLESIYHTNKKLKEALMEAIQCKGSNAQDLADKDLGKIFRELTYDYIAHSMEDLI